MEEKICNASKGPTEENTVADNFLLDEPRVEETDLLHIETRECITEGTINTHEYLNVQSEYNEEQHFDDTKLEETVL